MIDSSCDTFSFVSNDCKLLKADQLFKDDTEQLEIYMEASLAAREYDEYRSVIWILAIVTSMKNETNILGGHPIKTFARLNLYIHIYTRTTKGYSVT